MNLPSSSSPDRRPISEVKNRDSLDFMSILIQASRVGAVSGAGGLFVGAIAGIIRSTSPLLFSLVSGIQCSILGSSITAFREVIIRSMMKSEVSSNEKLFATTVAGALGGGTSGAILRGRGNVIPGAIMFALFGATGQIISSKVGKNMREQESMKIWDVESWMNSRWSPLRAISDKEYHTILENKLFQVRSDITVIDEKIKSLTT